MMSFKLNVNNFIVIILLGFIDAVTMILPGVSGTAIFMILGVYEFILLLFSNIFSYSFFLFLIGLILGILITSKIVNCCFKNYNNETYLVIFGLMISSIVSLLTNTFNNSYNLFEFLFGLFLMLLGYFLGNYFDKN